MTAKVFLAVSFVILFSGCAAILDRTAIFHKAKPAPTSLVHLEQGKSVFVAVPGDSTFGGVSYLGSGRTVAEAIARAFSKRGVTVHVAGKQLTDEDAVAAAVQLKAGYVVQAVITRWEHRNGWFGYPDRVAVRITVVDVATGRVIAARSIEKRGRIVSVTTETPDSLLEDPLCQFANGLYRF